jgi:hypothetical protein
MKIEDDSLGFCGGLYDSVYKPEIKKRMHDIQIAPDVIVFKNSFDDPQKITQILRDSQNGQDPLIKEWTEWDIWGTMSKLDPQNKLYKDQKSDGAFLLREIVKSYWEAIEIYKNKYLNEKHLTEIGASLDIPTKEESIHKGKGWGQGDILLLDYDESQSYNTMTMDGVEYAMHHHTDRAPWLGANPHAFTLTFYPNDDYEGGHLSFVNMDNAEEKIFIDRHGKESKYFLIDEPILYKPEAGDLIFFRADLYHAVFPIKNGHKFFIRCFLTADFSKDYYDEKIKYSEEEWKSIVDQHRKDGFSKALQNAFVFKNVDNIMTDREQKIFVIRDKSVS